MAIRALPPVGSTDWYGHYTDLDAAVRNASAAATSNGWINVKDPTYGAVGDNVADDTAAIQAALNAVPTGGGAFGGSTVFFPPGVYRVTAPLTPKPYTHIVGSERSSRYWAWSPSATPPTTCGIRLSSAFAGVALFTLPANWTASSMSDISILGANSGPSANSGAGVKALAFNTTSTTEDNFRASNVAFIGFTGDVVSGKLYASRWDHCFFGGGHRWGLNPTSYFADSHWSNCYFAGFKLGSLNLDGTSSSGLNSFSSCRFERSGWNSATPSTPSAVGGVGIRLRRANDIRFIDCDTDANSAFGVDAALQTASAGALYNIHFLGCQFKRDGFGDMSTLGEYAGVKVAGFNSAGTWTPITNIHFTDCDVIAARATDDGSNVPTYIHPKYGLWFEHTSNCTWNGSRVNTGGDAGTEVVANRFYGGPSGSWEANNSNLNMRVVQDKLHSVPFVSAGTSRPANGLDKGMTVYDENVNKQIIYQGGGVWKDALGTVVGTAAAAPSAPTVTTSES